MNSSCCTESLMYWALLLYWRSVKEVFCLQLTHLILLGSMRSMSLSFFQKSCGGGEASTLHSNLTVSPSSAREFIIFWTKVGGRRTSWAAGELEVTQHRQLEGGTSHSRWVYTSMTYIKLINDPWSLKSSMNNLFKKNPVQPKREHLPKTSSLMVNLLSPARFFATHSYTPAWCTVTISMMNECNPFSHTSILW